MNSEEIIREMKDVIDAVSVLGAGMKITLEMEKACDKIRAELEKCEDCKTRRKIADRFRTAEEANAAHAKERVLKVVDWAKIKWLYLEDIEGESRLDYLKRCLTAGILKSDGHKELKRLEKQTAKK